MDVSVTTFNLNNLFSRFDFRGEVTALPEQPPIEFTSTFELPEAVPAIEAADLDPLECAPVLREYRTYKAKLVKGKDPKGRLMLPQSPGAVESTLSEAAYAFRTWPTSTNPILQ